MRNEKLKRKSNKQQPFYLLIMPAFARAFGPNFQSFYLRFFFLITLTIGGVAFLNSCDDDTDDLVEVIVARPLTMSLSEFRAEVALTAPQPIKESGKIYVYLDYIFVGEVGKGVHIIDNRDPSAPVRIGFLNIPGNADISIRGDFLFADSLFDLVVLDISDLSSIWQVTRLEGVLQYPPIWPVGADIIEGEFDYENEVVVGWTRSVERRRPEDLPQVGVAEDFALANTDGGSNTGEGGSLARFKIVGDFLYAVDSHSINVFDITNLKAPIELPDVYAGFDIETIYNRGEHLFLGGRRGMYIFDINDPAAPNFISEFQHGTACDPVVVDGDFAYVTLRGGNGCGATESGLFIVDISNITNPVLATSYPMVGPYGLGLSADLLFVCDGEAGLKVYDRSDVLDLKMLDRFPELFAYDVIPLQDRLVLVGDGEVRQYNYTEGSIELLSRLSLR
ncbi:LVIVD repeat-containing protein [Robiginitalea myxolifaciens]|uniref:LVIVD repeat-containing protein n=1 Tax=Robiginitalea myxolifaciens TaxID=400055 RepID=A0A1I6GBF8_9FLAO|nr:hypothetical protein [Robiginitalea myxolifaciens]SFR39481.1 LVIVD repeat-containing protein [Robiginitalea myxolifaciens]